MAEKRIFPYLQGNKYNGIMFNVSKKLLVVCYADADFAGLWGHENPQYPIFARSRAGFVATFFIVLFSGCQNYRQRLISLL